MLGDISGAANIYIITGYTDMRKSTDGLCHHNVPAAVGAGRSFHLSFLWLTLRAYQGLITRTGWICAFI